MKRRLFRRKGIGPPRPPPPQRVCRLIVCSKVPDAGLLRVSEICLRWMGRIGGVTYLNLVSGVHAASGLLEHFPAAAFSCAGLAHDKVAMTNSQQLVQLRYLRRNTAARSLIHANVEVRTEGTIQRLPTKTVTIYNNLLMTVDVAMHWYQIVMN